jgi:cell division protein FtsQ
MAGDYVLDDSEARSGFERFIKIFIVIAAFCLGAELIWLLGISPFRPFGKIEISGSDVKSLGGIGRGEILAIAGIGPSSSYFSTNVMKIENALMGISQIESARVFKIFPGRLRIVLEGRKAVACALAFVDNRTVPVVFDSQGVIYEIGGETLSDFYPVISGLVIEDPFPGMRLPGPFIPFLKELEKIEMSAPELLYAVSEFRISRKLFDGFDLILYPAHKKIKVRISELSEDLLRYALLMVDVLSADASSNKIDTLDFRSGIASYIPKEAYPE